MRKAQPLVVFGLPTLLTVAGCHGLVVQTATAGKVPTPRVKRPQTAKDLLGHATISILKGALRVETFRISDKPPKPRYKPGGDRALYQGKTRGKHFARRLVGLLLDDNTYRASGVFNPSYSCIFEPFAAYHLLATTGSVDVTVCFHCKEWIIETRNVSGKIIHVSGGTFRGVRAQLIALTQEAFPKDKDARRLSRNIGAGSHNP